MTYVPPWPLFPDWGERAAALLRSAIRQSETDLRAAMSDLGNALDWSVRESFRDAGILSTSQRLDCFRDAYYTDRDRDQEHKERPLVSLLADLVDIDIHLSREDIYALRDCIDLRNKVQHPPFFPEGLTSNRARTCLSTTIDLLTRLDVPVGPDVVTAVRTLRHKPWRTDPWPDPGDWTGVAVWLLQNAQIHVEGDPRFAVSDLFSSVFHAAYQFIMARDMRVETKTPTLRTLLNLVQESGVTLSADICDNLTACETARHRVQHYPYFPGADFRDGSLRTWLASGQAFLSSLSIDVNSAPLPRVNTRMVVGADRVMLGTVSTVRAYDIRPHLPECQATIELCAGMTGFLSQWNTSWRWHNSWQRDLKAVLKVGTRKRCVVLERLSSTVVRIGTRQLGRPPATPPIGEVVDVEIVGLSNRYAVVRMRGGYYGCLPATELFWTNNPFPLDRLRVGLKTQAELVSVETHNEVGWLLFSIRGTRHLWRRLQKTYRRSVSVIGRVSRYTTSEKGSAWVGVDMERGVEGFVADEDLDSSVRSVGDIKSLVGKAVHCRVSACDRDERMVYIRIISIASPDIESRFGRISAL